MQSLNISNVSMSLGSSSSMTGDVVVNKFHGIVQQLDKAANISGLSLGGKVVTTERGCGLIDIVNAPLYLNASDITMSL